MKKNKMMRAVAVLLVAVLLTTSMISGTFAKYVTKGEGSDSARVAKFGVVVSAEGALFAQNYYRKDLGNTPGVTEGAGDQTLTVESNGGDNVVAPGTKSTGDGLKFTISGQPEVDVQVSFALDIKKNVYLKARDGYQDMTAVKAARFDLEEDYYPIVFTLKKGNTVIATGNHNTIAAALADATQYYDANTDLAVATAANAYTLTWEWDFDADGAGTNDKADTLLGDLAAGIALRPASPSLKRNTDYSLDVDVAFTVTVTQVD